MIISNRASIYEKWDFRCCYQTQYRSTSNEQWPNIERAFPWGRYLFHQILTSKDSKIVVETLRGIKDKKGINTQCLLARTVCFTASTKCSIDGDGMHSLSAPICMRWAFCSGRKSNTRPSSLLYAFRPSSNP